MPPALSAITSFLTGPDQRERPHLAEDNTGMAELHQMWAQIPDPRDRRGRRHPLTVIMTLVQAAIVSGATSYAAIRHWIASAPDHVLADIGARQNRRTGRFEVPHPDTVLRTLKAVDPAAVDAAYAAHRAAQLAHLYDDETELIPMTVDGKTLAGSGDGSQRPRHRLGAFLAADGLMVAQLDVGNKTNEINAFAPLLDQIPDLTGVVISADMMHTQRKHARYLRSRGAHYVLPVGGNQPRLFAQLDALPWKDIPIGWTTYDRGHGRIEIRTLQVQPAPPGLRFPHARQVYLVERYVYDLAMTPTSAVAVLGVTSLTSEQADPRRLADFIRGEWSIENKDHYVRDVTFAEDRCRIRTGALPSILATMRSYAVSALRLLGFTNIAEGTRWARDDFTRPLIALGLTT
jgi:predicted transposase YbfD/YdcC